jgi:hypothetical protein
LPQIKHMRACLKGLCARKFRGTLPWSAAHVAYSVIRPKSQISNIRHDEKSQESWIWDSAPEKCAPCFRGTRNFLFIFNIFLIYERKLENWKLQKKVYKTFLVNIFKTFVLNVDKIFFFKISKQIFNGWRSIWGKWSRVVLNWPWVLSGNCDTWVTYSM